MHRIRSALASRAALAIAAAVAFALPAASDDGPRSFSPAWPAASADSSAGSATPSSSPGATIDDLLAMGRRMSPEVAAAALETEAALARVDAAGRLPDPTFSTEFRDMTRQRSSPLPDELARVEYRIEQEFPLWGKLGLQEDVARAKAGAARQTQRATELEVAARIKTVFAARYAAFESWRLTRDLSKMVATLADATQSRYAQGLGEQEDVIRAEVEKTRLRTEMLRFEADQRQTAAQLNALLDRPADAPLAAPLSLRPIPEQASTLPDLLDQGRRDNPAIGAAQSQVAAAEGDRALVERSWYPDVTLGATFQQFVDQSGRSPGYEALIGAKVPLQWGLREAWEREAAANLAAARRRRDAAAASVRGDVGKAYWSLDGSRQIARVLQEVQLPQSRLALQTALRGYEHGRSNLNTVLDTEQRVFETMLRLLVVQVEQQARLADIERLIGSDL